MLAALNGNGFADGGVWKTTDGGVTWTNTTAEQMSTTMLCIYRRRDEHHNPNILYTTIGYPGAYGGNGVFKTTDGGTTWTRLTGGLPLPANGDPVGGQTTLALYPSQSTALPTRCMCPFPTPTRTVCWACTSPPTAARHSPS